MIVNVTTSVNTTWKLYSDASCTTVITNNVMLLTVGKNTAYVKVTAQDGIISKIYSVTVTRNGVISSSASAKPGEKAKIDFTIEDAKNLTYCEFTVVYDANSLEISTIDANDDEVYDAIVQGDFKVLSHSPITVDTQDPSKRRITIAVQYDANNGYPSTSLLANLCGINFDVKTTSTIGSTTVEILNNTSDQTNCYGMDKDSNVVMLDNPKAGIVNVTQQPVASISITGASNITVNKQTEGYAAQILPDYATNKAVAWGASDTAIASIDESGMLTPITNGTVNVIATAKDGSGVNGQKTVIISGQKAFLTTLASTNGIMATPFTQYSISYNVNVQQNATSVILKPNFSSGTLKYNGLAWANNFGKSFNLTGTTTEIKFDLTQPNLDTVTYTINVIKTADGFISNDMAIYNGSQRLEAIPQTGGKYNIKTTYGNNSANSNSAYYILTVKSNNRLISAKIVLYTFAPSEVYTFDNVVTLPSKDISPNLEIKAILWKNIDKLSPYSLPLSIFR